MYQNDVINNFSAVMNAIIKMTDCTVKFLINSPVTGDIIQTCRLFTFSACTTIKNINWLVISILIFDCFPKETAAYAFHQHDGMAFSDRQKL